MTKIRKRYKESDKAYREKNKEIISAKKKIYIEKNKEKIREQARRYYEKNKEKISEKSKIYEQKNKDKRKAQKKIYNENNKAIRNKKNSIYLKKKKKEDKLFNLKSKIRAIIHKSFNRAFYRKNTTTQKILGCTFLEFKTYLESQFESWMTWDNYGKYNGTLNFGWDMDHIIPLVTAKSVEDVVLLNHHSNIRPLCSYVNRNIKRQDDKKLK